jgi:hypothetical protein
MCLHLCRASASRSRLIRRRTRASRPKWSAVSSCCIWQVEVAPANLVVNENVAHDDEAIIELLLTKLEAAAEQLGPSYKLSPIQVNHTLP